MSADLKRCQELAEPLGFSVVADNHNGFYSNISGRIIWYQSLALIRERLANEYRELAKQADKGWRIALALDNNAPMREHSTRHNRFTAIADELSVVKEPKSERTTVDSTEIGRLIETIQKVCPHALSFRQGYAAHCGFCGKDSEDSEQAPNEPTIVERLKEERDRPLDLCSYEQLFLDALIQFGERLDAIERGKE